MKPGLKIPPILLEGDDPTPTPASGPGQKFALGEEPTAKQSPPQLPASYGTGKLFLTARDPHGLYAHWDPTPEQELWYDCLVPTPKGLFRVYPQGQGHGITEIPLAQGARKAFIPVPDAGMTYHAEVGFYELNGEWRALLKSPPVTTPPEAMAPPRPPEFTRVPWVPSTEPEPPRPPARPSFAMARAETPRHREHQPPAPRPPRAAMPPHDMAPEQQPTAHGPAGVPARVSSAFQQQVLKEAGVWRDAGVAAPERLTAEFLTQEFEATPALSSIQAAALELPLEAAITSLAGPAPAKARGFWFKVDAELVVYGATEPGAKVTMEGQPIELREDGTFSLRLAFPDGVHGLGLAAESVEGETRHAKLIFVRSTEAGG